MDEGTRRLVEQLEAERLRHVPAREGVDVARRRNRYARLYADMPEHPRLSGLSDGAWRLYVEGLVHCASLLTDGAISPSFVTRRSGGRTQAAELVRSGAWLPQPGGGWLVHDYLDHQPSRVEIENASKRGRSAAEARWRE